MSEITMQIQFYYNSKAIVKAVQEIIKLEVSIIFTVATLTNIPGITKMY